MDEINKLGIVTGDSSGIRVTNPGGYGFMLGYTDSETGNEKILSNESDFRRPIYLSELKTYLQRRCWNSPMSRYVDNNGNLMINMSGSKERSVMDLEPGEGDIPASGTVGYTVGNSILENTEIKKILSDMEKSNIYLYNVSKSVVDLLENTVTYNLVNYGSDVYTNTVSLGEISKNFVYPGRSGKIELSIQYSKEDKVFNHDTTFEAFRYIESANKDSIVSPQFTENVKNDVTIEFINDIIRVVPISKEVGECIISNCSLTYGKIGS